MSVTIYMPIEPVPFARAGAHGKVRFTPKRQADFMGQFRLFAMNAMSGRPPLEGPLKMEATFVYAAPASWSKKKRAETVWKQSRPDTSNLVKIVEDAINAVVYHDDAQIAVSQVQKKYGDRAEIIVTVSELS